ncbi:hypothetical protein DPX39_070016400 [Trypanosoma brucei equiperdum]|uniref:Uncharacterized protein n=1 Tax=Trypanosoma brucei equiperdum TaxID=630700 RepID=A0A3L6L855_9TRYP|nr:hypothetical protein DPX39_070016400 [Trypanosoma brucei equiperdum]
MDITAPATEFTVCVEEYKVVSSQGPRVLHEVRHRLYRSINMKREHNKSFDASFGQPVEFFVTECNDLHVFIIHLLYRGRLFAWSSVNALYEGPWVSKLRKPPVDMAVALVVEHINLDDPILRGFISDKASDDLGEAEAYLNRLESQPPATNKTVENMNDPSVSAVNLRPRMSAKTGVDKASETIQHTKTQRQNYDENGKVVLAASPVPPVTKKSFSHKEERESTSPSGPQNSTAILKPYPREYREERETTSPSDPQNSTATLKPYPREYREERETTSPSDPQNSTATLKPYPREYREERETTSPSDPQNSTATLKPYPREYREERETTSPSDPQNSTATLKPYPREYREERETTSPSDPQNSTAILKPYPREYREERETTSPSDPQNSTATLRRFRSGGMDGRDGRDHTGAVTCQSNGGCVSSKGESSDTKTNGASGTRNRGRNNDGNGDKITGGSGSQRFPVEERVSPLSACALLGLRSEGDVPSSRKIGSEREGFASVDLRVNKIVGLPPNCLCARVLVYFVNYISR